MKKLFMVICLSALIASCLGSQKVGVVPCIVDKPDGSQISLIEFCADVKMNNRTSYICSLQEDYKFDPCILHRGMEVASKEGLILEGYTFEEFEAWAQYTKDRVKNGVTYGDLKTIVLAQFTKINKMVGAQIFLFGDMFLQLPQDKLIPDDDIILVVSSIDDLVSEVRGLSIWVD